MGFFKRMFGRRKGGSPMGNFLRTVGDNFTGGNVSKIFKPSKRDGKFIAKLREQGKLESIKQTTTADLNFNNGKSSKNEVTMWQKVKTFFMKKPVQIGLGVVASFAIVWAAFFRNPKKKRRRSY